MRRRMVYLLLIVCSVSFFSGCGQEEEQKGELVHLEVGQFASFSLLIPGFLL